MQYLVNLYTPSFHSLKLFRAALTKCYEKNCRVEFEPLLDWLLRGIYLADPFLLMACVLDLLGVSMEEPATSAVRIRPILNAQIYDVELMEFHFLNFQNAISYITDGLDSIGEISSIPTKRLMPLSVIAKSLISKVSALLNELLVHTQLDQKKEDAFKVILFTHSLSQLLTHFHLASPSQAIVLCEKLAVRISDYQACTIMPDGNWLSSLILVHERYLKQSTQSSSLLTKIFSDCLSTYTSNFVSNSPKKRKRVSEVDSENLSLNPKKLDRKRTSTDFVSASAIFFGFCEACLLGSDYAWLKEWKQFDKLKTLRKYLHYQSSDSSIDLEWEWIAHRLQDVYLQDEGLTIFYLELDEWLKFSVCHFSEENVTELIIILLSHMESPSFSNSQWMMVACLQIIKTILPSLVTKFACNKDLKNSLIQLLQAFMIKICSKKLYSNSNEYRIGWRVSVTFSHLVAFITSSQALHVPFFVLTARNMSLLNQIAY
jgi:hypothetical protein